MDRNLLSFILLTMCVFVALRKESVDRNHKLNINNPTETMSLSARRAWIEIAVAAKSVVTPVCRSPQGERG